MAFGLASIGGQIAASAGASAFDNITNGLFSGWQIRKQLKAQKELAQYQFDLNQKQWQAENEYNSPVQQMQRLQDAGLNPNLVYGNSGVTGNTTTNGPRYEAPKVDRNLMKFNFATQLLSTFQDFRMKQAQIDLMKEQANNYHESSSLTQVERGIRALALSLNEKYGDKERGAALESLNWRTLAAIREYNQSGILFGHQLEALKLSNQNAKRALKNAALDAVLKVDRHKLNAQELGAWPHRLEILKNQASVSGKEDSWFTTNMVVNYLLSLLGVGAKFITKTPVK